ncbi:nuclear hormone receptor HR96-like [Oppia nitens]|uniref:nuclear hormone receptor HR96-like n=1 Tax=Oppia nitens TaxID=1686743 RepID=UPI0023DC1440|nr:nuclear hormone receptor HR96-like [Oppia nitens]
MDIMADIESQIQEIADQVVTTNNELNGTVGRQPLLLLPPQELSSLAASVAVIPTVERPILPNYRNTFNELEGLKLQELIRAANIFRDVPRVSQTQTIVFGYRPPNLFERHMRRLTKMCQQLTAFSSICQTDAIALVKYGCVDLFCMRSVPNYNCTDDNWTFALDNQDSIIINMKAIKNFPSNVYHFSRKFYHQICREWDTDLVILDLLTAIILFNPDRPNLLHKHMIKYHQHLYLYLLQRYLLLKYRTESAAQLKFRRLMNCLVDFKVLSDYGGDQSAGHLCRRRSNSTIATTVTTEAAAPVPSAEGCAINMDNDKSTENTTQTIQFRPSLSLYTIILSQVFESMTINDN